MSQSVSAMPTFLSDLRSLLTLGRFARRSIPAALGALGLAYVAADLRGTAIRAIAAVTDGLARPGDVHDVAGAGTVFGTILKSAAWSPVGDRAAVIAAVAALLVAASLLVLYRDVLRMRISAGFKTLLRHALLSAFSYERTSAWSRRGTGRVVDMYRSDVDSASTVAVFGVVGVLEAVVQLAVYSTLLVRTLGEPGLGLLAFFLIYSAGGEFLATRVAGARQRQAMADFYDAQKRSLTVTSRFFDTFRELVLLGGERSTGVDITRHWTAVDDRSVRVRVWSGVGSTFTDVLQQVSIPIILIVVAVTGGDVGAVLGAALLLGQMAGPLAAALTFPRALAQVSPSLHSLQSVLAAESGSAEPPAVVEALATRAGGAAVTLSEVSVRFEAEARDQLSGVTLHIPAGAFVSVVGPSGGGKTTLARVIAGELRPSAGRVMIDDVDVIDWAEAWRRRLVAFAPSPPNFLMETLRTNISFGRSVPESELEAAVSAAGFAPVVLRQAAGLDTPLADTNLSTGEQRRLALARALCSGQRVLVLDEPTAQLDRERLREAAAGLHQFVRARSRTCIVATHDEELVRLTDFVIVVANGTIAAVGTPHELSRTSADYAAALAARQPTAAPA